MQNSYAYGLLIKQLNATGSNKKDGYYPKLMEEIYEWEKDEVEDIVWKAFNEKHEIGVAQYLPKINKYDGIKALKECPFLNQIPSGSSVEIAKVLYEATDNEEYLEMIKKNIDACPDNISFVSTLSYCKPCPKLNSLLIDIYINNENKVNRNTAVMGLLYEKKIIKDRASIQEANNTIELRKKFKSEDREERISIINRFEAGELL